MLNLFKAEWQKIVGNRWTTGFLLWVFPIGVVVLFSIMFLLAGIFPEVRQGLQKNSPGLWTDGAMGAWLLTTNIIFRMFLLGFITVNLAGEYQWQTWKNIIPRSQRAKLLLAKFSAITSAILLSVGLMSLALAIGTILSAKLFGHPVMPAFTLETLRTFGKDYLTQLFLSFTSVVIMAGISALAAMKMRSILGGVMVGLGISVAEPASFAGLFGLSQLFSRPRIYHLVRLFPLYNIDNATEWLFNDQPSNFSLQEISEYAFTDSLNFSLLMLVGWVILLTFLLLYLFQRQDITG